jgi:hypothetical protein
MNDLFIPTSHACRLLGITPRNTATLHRLKIPYKKEFTSLLWSRDAIYSELKRRRQLSHPPPGFITMAEVAKKLGRTISYTHSILTKNKIKPSHAVLWNGCAFRNTIIYPLKQIRKLIDHLSFIKNSFPPEGWLEIKDCTEYLSRTPEGVRQLCRAHNVRIKKLRHSKQLYNEDDIVALRKYLRSRRRNTPISAK